MCVCVCVLARNKVYMYMYILQLQHIPGTNSFLVVLKRKSDCTGDYFCICNLGVRLYTTCMSLQNRFFEGPCLINPLSLVDSDVAFQIAESEIGREILIVFGNVMCRSIYQPT